MGSGIAPVQVLGLRFEEEHDDGRVKEAALQRAQLGLDGGAHLREAGRAGVLRDVHEEVARPVAVPDKQEAVVDACEPRALLRVLGLRT